MDRRNNPYAPGAGLQPPELAGRDRLLEDAAIDMDRVLNRRPTKGMMLLGLRGVGKTVLLNRLHSMAEQKGFRTAKVEAPEGGMLPQLLAPELRQVLYSLDLQASAGHKVRQAASVLRNFVAAFKVKIGDIEIGIDQARGEADTGNLEQDLPDLLVAVCEAANERSVALGIFLDEVQYLSPEELASLIVACHEVAQRNLPLFFVGAGLPQIAALSGNAKSYAERLFTYPQVGQLDADAARAALVHPAKNEGVDFQADAVEEILRVTERYPYFIQEWGFQVWNSAPGSPIQFAHVQQATPDIIAHLDANFFRVRFDRLTPLQQKYLRAMAELGAGPHQTGDIAAMLGVAAGAVATVRQQLINKGMVWSQRHGETAFTVPLFNEFMRRQMPKLEKHEPKRRPHR
jgi:AAA ATPase domain